MSKDIEVIKGNQDEGNKITKRSQDEGNKITKRSQDEGNKITKGSQDREQKEKQEKTLIISAKALLAKDFPEPKWIVQDILPEGTLSILTARPKAGKTFLALQLAVSIALGRNFLLKRTEKKNILFLSYELNARQVKNRLSLLLERFGVSPEQVINWSFKRFPILFSFAGRLKGLEGLKSLLEKLEKTKKVKFDLVFVDTYVLFKDLNKQAKRENKTAYEFESEYLAELRKFCEEKNISIVLIYHNRKKQAVSGDITEEVMGSTGITGAVNNLLLLERKTGEKEAHLKVTGHDIEEQDIELTFDKGFFKLRTIRDKEQEIIELVTNYLKQIGQANQSSIRDYLKNKGYRSVHEIKDILDKYSQENPNTPTYWYCVRKKREGGGTSLKVYSLNPPSNFEQGSLLQEEQEDDLQERRNLIERVESLISEGVISLDDFPEKIEEYGVYNFKSLVNKALDLPLDVFREFVERLESYSQEQEYNFDIDDEDYDFEF